MIPLLYRMHLFHWFGSVTAYGYGAPWTDFWIILSGRPVKEPEVMFNKMVQAAETINKF